MKSVESVRFEELYSTPSRNGVYKPAMFHGSGTKIVNMGELFAHEFIGNQEMSRLRLTESEIQASGLNDGDLLFGRRSLVESGAGKCSLVYGLIEPTTFESSLIRVRLDQDRVDPTFLYYWFKSPSGRGRISAIVSGTNVKGIRGSDLRNVLVPVPELDVQKRLARTLLNYDKLIHNNRRRIKLLEDTARLIYREWFVRLRFPGCEFSKIEKGVPEGWKKATLGEIADVVMGQSPDSKFYNEVGAGLPFHQGVKDFGLRYPTTRMYCDGPGRIVEEGDILVSVRAPVGRLNYAGCRMVIGRGLAAVRSKSGNQSFLFQLLKGFFFKEDIIGSGAIYAAVTRPELLGIELLSPPSSVVEGFCSIVDPIEKQIRILGDANERLARARDLLLPRLMSGEIDT